MENQEKHDEIKNIIKRKIKDEVKSELRQELLDEIYRDLLLEEKHSTIEESLSIKESPLNTVPKEYEENIIKIEDEQQIHQEILISIKAILKIASHALKYANDKIPKKKWVEVIGLLAGKIDKRKDILSIEDAFPIGHGNAIHAEMNFDRNKRSGHVKAHQEIWKQKLFVCGWYHSHPSYGCFMSAEDLYTQTEYQKHWEEAVALVIDPYLIDGTSTGFEIYRANLKTKTFYPLLYGIKGSLDIRMLPDILAFMNPIIHGKPVYLEYDQD